ncbi:MAG: hypothetical protein ISS31_05705 [Kiritimatiellae bacterium]|nr:hypothetical protein [Kiritimatiellia bacterium]
MRCSIVLLLAVGLAAGCGKPSTSKREAKRTKSTAQTMIEGVTGHTAVKAGQKAKADITRISEQRNRDLEAAME